MNDEWLKDSLEQLAQQGSYNCRIIYASETGAKYVTHIAVVQGQPVPAIPGHVDYPHMIAADFNPYAEICDACDHPLPHEHDRQGDPVPHFH